MGVEAAFVVDSATYLVSRGLSRSPPLPDREGGRGTGFGEDLRAGSPTLRGERVPLAIVVGAFLTVLTVKS